MVLKAFDEVEFEDSRQFKKLFLDFNKGSLYKSSFYPYSNSLSDFREFFQSHSFKKINRELLAERIKSQYHGKVNAHEKVLNNLELLKSQNSFTVCTGHQLCLFSGPLYVIHKILTVINRCEALKQKFPDQNFIPVFWLASEDHDIEEINHVFIQGKKLSWETKEKGKAGKISTHGIAKVIDELELEISKFTNDKSIIEIFKSAYLNSENLTESTRYLINYLFGNFGLVIVDGDDEVLKKTFSGIILRDIKEQHSFKKVSETIQNLEKDKYAVQVHPRNINFFFSDGNNRDRIILENYHFKVLNREIEIPLDQLDKWVDSNIQNISPNVVTRPLYQQFILPNIEYVGGPGEIAYWLQYYSLFKEYEIQFPMLSPRYFLVFVEEKYVHRIKKYKLPIKAFFNEPNELISHFFSSQASVFTLDNEIKVLEEIKIELSKRIAGIDESLVKSAEAGFQKFYSNLEQLRNKVQKSIKLKEEASIQRLLNFRNQILPENVLMEIKEAGCSFLAIDKNFIQNLKELMVETKDSQKIKLVSY